MANKYLTWISDEHLTECISNLYDSYVHAKEQIDKKKFYKNKIDTIKLTFDSKFNKMDSKTLIKAEISRQIDKSINNAIGTFHEEILNGIEGYEMGNHSGYDIKAQDNSLFADLKNKHNTMNSSASESLFQKLETYANDYPEARCYWVQIWATSSFNELWSASLNGKEYSHERVYKISGDQFYKLLTGQENALFELYQILPTAIDDFLKTVKKSKKKKNSALDEITECSKKSGREIIDEITYDNFSYYFGFDSL